MEGEERKEEATQAKSGGNSTIIGMVQMTEW